MVLHRKSGQVTVPISEFPCNYLCNYLKSLGLSLPTSKMLELDVRVCICNPSQRRLGHEDQCEFRASLGYMGSQASLHMHPTQPSFHPIYFFLPLPTSVSHTLPPSLSLSLSLTHTHTPLIQINTPQSVSCENFGSKWPLWESGESQGSISDILHIGYLHYDS